eukprot:symbB.v1.2.012665.t1/scaffold881.1/size155427/4
MTCQDACLSEKSEYVIVHQEHVFLALPHGCYSSPASAPKKVPVVTLFSVTKQTLHFFQPCSRRDQLRKAFLSEVAVSPHPKALECEFQQCLQNIGKF